MRKTVISSLLIGALTLSSTGVHADEEQIPPAEVAAPATNAEVTAPETNPEVTAPETNTQVTAPETREPREVGAASNDAAQAARTRRWHNIALAGAAVIVAATAIYLASINGGHND